VAKMVKYSDLIKLENIKNFEKLKPYLEKEPGLNNKIFLWLLEERMDLNIIDTNDLEIIDIKVIANKSYSPNAIEFMNHYKKMKFIICF
jgi:hypothetical protein